MDKEERTAILTRKNTNKRFSSVGREERTVILSEKNTNKKIKRREPSSLILRKTQTKATDILCIESFFPLGRRHEERVQHADTLGQHRYFQFVLILQTKQIPYFLARVRFEKKKTHTHKKNS